MADRDQDIDVLDDVEVLEEEVDNAKDLTTWLVIATTVMLILAVVFIEMALGSKYGIGPFA